MPSVPMHAAAAAPLADPVSTTGRGMRVHGFTLFEVAISLVILAFGVVSIMALFPAGLKAQQLARFQLYAAAKAEEMIEQFNTAHFDNATADTGPARAEHADTMNPLALTYLNRLSDLLFILARYANRDRGDVLWVPGGSRPVP